ncbi:hypothetical protein B0H14DRAFT_2607005 [Mycena olivaceomarginata]|nr:hypothetical protein B0H14DRAFT_2607005 [Mycena olivaceomarginata]
MARDRRARALDAEERRERQNANSRHYDDRNREERNAKTRARMARLRAQEATMSLEEQAVRREARHAADKNYCLRHSNRLAADARLHRQLAAKAKADHQYARIDARASDRAWEAVREVLREDNDNGDDAEQTTNETSRENSCQYRHGLKLCNQIDGEGVESWVWRRLEAEYLLLEEYHDWVELRGIEITQRWNRTSEETERDTVIEKCWTLGDLRDDAGPESEHESDKSDVSRTTASLESEVNARLSYGDKWCYYQSDGGHGQD